MAIPNPGPGYAKHPEHTVTVEPARERVRVSFGGELVADTTRALRLREAKYPPVYYIPRSDVRMDRLVRTDHQTHCPYKGDASYFSIHGNSRHGPAGDNAIWSYEAPYDEVLAIKDHLAFYPNKVDEITVG